MALRPAATRAYRWPAWGLIDPASRPDLRGARARAASATTVAAFLWIRVSSLGSSELSRRKPRRISSRPWTLIPLSAATRCQELARSEEHTSELQSRENLVCRLLREKKK